MEMGGRRSHAPTTPAIAACRAGNARKSARQTGIHPKRATYMRNTTAMSPASIRECRRRLTAPVDSSPGEGSGRDGRPASILVVGFASYPGYPGTAAFLRPGPFDRVPVEIDQPIDDDIRMEFPLATGCGLPAEFGGPLGVVQ